MATEGKGPHSSLARDRRIYLTERGAVLIAALLMLLILTLIGISAVSTTTYETNIAGNERLYNRSFYAADAGIDYFYATNNSYISVPNSTGTFDSAGLGLNLNGDQFVVNWEKLSVDFGPPLTVQFRVRSQGTSPSLPTAGLVRIEAVIDGRDGDSTTIDPQGGNT